MFGKKKLSGIPVQHYEGLDFPTDFPCRIELTKEALTIKRIKPEVTITLPINQIKAFSAFEEKRFMMKYHGNDSTTSKAKGIDKYYLVVDYISKDGDPKYIAFWGTISEYGKFMDLEHTPLITQQNYTL